MTMSALSALGSTALRGNFRAPVGVTYVVSAGIGNLFPAASEIANGLAEHAVWGFVSGSGLQFVYMCSQQCCRLHLLPITNWRYMQALPFGLPAASGQNRTENFSLAGRQITVPDPFSLLTPYIHRAGRSYSVPVPNLAFPHWETHRSRDWPIRMRSP